MKKTLSVVFGLCLLSACAGAPPRLSSSLPPPNKAAVVVAIGPEIGVTAHGVTVIGNWISHVPVPDWNLENIAADEMTKVLSPRMKVVKATADGVIYIPNIDNFRYKSIIEDNAKTRIHLSEPVDLVFLLTNSGYGLVNDPNNSMYGFDTGLGVSKQYELINTIPPYVHAFLRIVILDGKSLTPLADSILQVSPRLDPLAFFGRKTTLPFQISNDFEWHNKWEDMTATQHDLVHRTLITLMTEGIDTTLPQMFAQ